MVLHWACGVGFDKSIKFELTVFIVNKIHWVDYNVQAVAISIDNLNYQL